MHALHKQLLAQLLAATRGGRAVWRPVGAGTMQAKLAGLLCAVRFKHPVLADEEVVEPDLAEITVGTAVLRFYAGSEGFSMAREIVEIGGSRDGADTMATHLLTTIWRGKPT